MNKNILFSLCFNLVSETEKMLKRIHRQNDIKDYSHTVIDLSFPLLEGDKIPDNFERAKKINTEALKELADRYKSKYLKLPNNGVQPNHSAFYKHIKPGDTDCLIVCDVDEVTLNDGWVEAMATALRNDRMLAMVSLLQVGIEDAVKPELYDECIYGDNRRIWLMKANFNWAMIAFSGSFLNKINCTLPFPDNAKVYGFIEMLVHDFEKHGYRWAILPDQKVDHTNLVPLYREWKDYIILQNPHQPQLHFEEWLEFKRDGTI